MKDGNTKSRKREYYCDRNHTYGLEIHHHNRIWYGVMHTLGVYGIYLILTGVLPWAIAIPNFFLGYFAGLGITAGCHRYWSHRTYKAKLPLQLLLAFAQTSAAQKSIFKWCRDHRLHHKYTETNADPYNAKRGFWFSHMGWLLEKEHPEVQEKEDSIDLTDLDNDPVVRFQAKHYQLLEFISVFVVPMSILHWLFPQLTLFHLICANFMRCIFTINFTSLVNSAAHLYGWQPYDKGIFARENRLVALLAMGEGFHNFHHVFPWDYKTSELGAYGFNWTCAFIDTFAKLGLAYDLKTVPHEVVMQRVERTGNSTLHHELSGFEHPGEDGEEGHERDPEPTTNKPLPPWGWGDTDIPLEHYNITQTLRKASKAG